MSATNKFPHNQYEPWKTLSARVQHFRRHAARVFTIDLAIDGLDVQHQFAFAPGQFNMLYVPGVGEAAISIAGLTAAGMIQHTIHAVGSVTRAIEMGGIGMSLGLRGPFGNGWPLRVVSDGTSTNENLVPENGDFIIAAGGIGLAPLRSMVEYIAAHRQLYGTVSIVIGARTPSDLLYQEEYDDWRRQQISVTCTVDRASRDWNGQIGVVTLLLDRMAIPQPAQTKLLTCGPEVMMRYVAKSALSRGIPAHQICVTLERNMNCAIGLCGHCQLGPQFICKDGPVFRYDSVRSLLRIQEL